MGEGRAKLLFNFENACDSWKQFSKGSILPSILFMSYLIEVNSFVKS